MAPKALTSLKAKFRAIFKKKDKKTAAQEGETEVDTTGVAVADATGEGVGHAEQPVTADANAAPVLPGTDTTAVPEAPVSAEPITATETKPAGTA